MSDARPMKESRHFRLHPRERLSLLVVGDLVVGILALVVALYVWAAQDQWLGWSLEFLRERPAIWFYLLPLAWLVLLVDLYEIRRVHDWRATLWGVTRSALIGLFVYLLFYFLFPPKSLPRRGVAVFLVTVVVLTLLWRWVYIRVFTRPAFMRRALVVGAGRAGTEILQVIRALPSPPFQVVGVLDDDPSKQGQEVAGFPVLGGSEHLLELVAREAISDIIVAVSGSLHGRTFQALLDAQEQGVEITRMPVVYEDLLGRVPIRYLEVDWLLRSFVDHGRVSSFYLMAKRAVDLLGALVGVLVLGLIFPWVSLAILLDDGRPVFFSQARIGRAGRVFYVHKFRTMRVNGEGQHSPTVPGDDRMTRVGRVLRKTHLDELPQFLSVLRGDMSLVGPRPEQVELVYEFEKKVPFYRARLMVKPGLTGWAQINYGYASTVEETSIKLEYDLYYIKHRNFWLDLLILLRTPATILGMKGR